MKKLLLINPMGHRSGFLLSNFTTFPPLGLAYIAAVTPSDWEIKIIDENFGDFEFEDADLVGLTAFTSNISRAYDIARIYKEKNIKVILGGIHSSMLPDEALQHVDAVVIGEAEGIWQRVLSDFENNNLQAKYHGPQVDLAQFKVVPRRDLLHPGYFWNSVQTSRGCPFDCHFCSVSTHLGKNYRQRNAQDVLDEISQIEGEYVCFVDDNLIGYSEESRQRATEIFEGMIRRGIKKKWWMQTSINAAEDERIIQLAAQAGCMFAFIGFETTREEVLREMKKSVNLRTGVANYKKVADTFHKYGLGVMGAFIIGNDNENSSYYKELADFLTHSGIDVVQLTILTPMPGTRFMMQMEQEERLVYRDFPQDWDKYRFSYVVHRPQNSDADTINAGYRYIKDKLYSFPTYQYRLFKSFINLRNKSNFMTIRRLNKALKRSWINSHHNQK